MNDGFPPEGDVPDSRLEKLGFGRPIVRVLIYQ
jgi:hypothetical protein